MSDEEEGRVRLRGTHWVCTPEFVESLRDLLKVESAVSVAAKVSQEVGHEIHPSGLHKLKKGDVPTSILVGPLCRIYGWPVPPMAEAEAEGLGQRVAALYEIRRLDPEWAAEYEAAMDERLSSARRLLKLRRGTPENSDH